MLYGLNWFPRVQSNIQAGYLNFKHQSTPNIQSSKSPDLVELRRRDESIVYVLSISLTELEQGCIFTTITSIRCAKTQTRMQMARRGMFNPKPTSVIRPCVVTITLIRPFNYFYICIIFPSQPQYWTTPNLPIECGRLLNNFVSCFTVYRSIET